MTKTPLVKVKRRGRKPRKDPQTIVWEEAAWDLAVQGMTLNAIAKKLFEDTGRKVTKSTVHRWLTLTAQRAMKHLDERIIQHKIQQVDILQRVHFEAGVAWEKSKTGRHITERKRKTPLVAGQKGIPQPTEDITTTKTEPSPGDPRYLAVMLQAQTDIRKVLGLDAAIKVEHYPLRLADDQDLAEELKKLNRELFERSGQRLDLGGKHKPVNLVLPPGPPIDIERKPS